MQDSIVRECTKCGQSLRFPTNLGGMLMACPNCGQKYHSDFKIKGTSHRSLFNICENISTLRCTSLIHRLQNIITSFFSPKRWLPENSATIQSPSPLPPHCGMLRVRCSYTISIFRVPCKIRFFVQNQGMRKILPQAYNWYSEDKISRQRRDWTKKQFFKVA